MSVGRLVPWTCWEEWSRVGEWLLSADLVDNKKGLERVSAWRCRGRIPLGADITASLVETRLRDNDASSSGSHGPCTAHMVRLQYSMAIVRMVNGIADSAQQGRVASSVASLAASAGLPRVLVDLRHEASHNELPSLGALRVACDHALAWLQSFYWSGQQQHLAECSNKIISLLQEYVGLHRAAARATSVRGGSPVPSLGEADDDEEEEEEEEDGVQQSSGYVAAAAKKRRRLLLGELKSIVPLAATDQLAVHCMDTPGLQELPDSEADSSELVQWQAILTPLCRQWPALRGCLLSTAATRVEQVLHRLPGSLQEQNGDVAFEDDIAKGCRSCRWVQLLMALQYAAAKERRSSTKGKGKRLRAEGCPVSPLSIPLTTPQFHTLLPRLLYAYNAAVLCANQSAAESSRPITGLGGKCLPAPAEEGSNSVRAVLGDGVWKLLGSLREAVKMLVKHPPSGSGKSHRAARFALHLVKCCEGAGKVQAGADAAGGSEGAGGGEGGVKAAGGVEGVPHAAGSPSAEDAVVGDMRGEVDALMSALHEAERTQWKLLADRRSSVCMSDTAAAESDVEHSGRARKRRFVRVCNWSQCAIGNLPDAFNPNGRIPRLDATAGRSIFSEGSSQGVQLNAGLSAGHMQAVANGTAVDAIAAEGGVEAAERLAAAEEAERPVGVSTGGPPVPSALTLLGGQLMGDDVSTCHYNFDH